MIDSLVIYASAQRLVPDRAGRAHSGRHRDDRVPRGGRGDVPARRQPAGTWHAASRLACPQRRRRRASCRPRSPAPSSAARAFLIFPYDFRQALINSLIGVVVCLSLVVTTGFVGQVSIIQVALAGVAGLHRLNLAARGLDFPSRR